ncbi:MAG: hypothetical protein JO186_02135 [Actinobacteria bacterium]|nr:hypothetical protein [Actinomycetota bacterium]
MNRRRLEILQWAGLFAGGLVWATQHVLGFGITQAECSVGGQRWGISNDTWEGALMGAAALCVVGAWAASLMVLRATRATSYEDEPPLSRIRFFAIAAVTANALFLGMVLLDGFASIFDVTCNQA